MIKTYCMKTILIQIFKGESKCSHTPILCLALFSSCLCNIKFEIHKQKLITLFHFPIVFYFATETKIHYFKSLFLKYSYTCIDYTFPVYLGICSSFRKIKVISSMKPSLTSIARNKPRIH